MELPASASGGCLSAVQLALENEQLRQQLEHLAQQQLSAAAVAEARQREMEQMLKDLMAKQVGGAEIASAILPVLQRVQQSGVRYSAPLLHFLPPQKLASLETASLYEDTCTSDSCSAATAAPSAGSADTCQPLAWSCIEGRNNSGVLSFEEVPGSALRMSADVEDLCEPFALALESNAAELSSTADAASASAGADDDEAALAATVPPPAPASPKDILEPRVSVKPNKITWVAPPPWEEVGPRPNATSLPSYIVATTAEGTATSSAFSCMVMRDDTQGPQGSAVFSIRRSSSNSTFTSQGAAALAARLAPSSVTESVEEMDSDLLKDSFIKVEEVPSSQDVKSKVRRRGGGLASALKSPVSGRAVSASQIVFPSLASLSSTLIPPAGSGPRGAAQGEATKGGTQTDLLKQGVKAIGALFSKKLSTISDSPWAVAHASSSAQPEALGLGLGGRGGGTQAPQERPRHFNTASLAASRSGQLDDGHASASSSVASSSYASSLGEELFAVSVGTPATPPPNKETPRRNKRSANSTGRLSTTTSPDLIRLDTAAKGSISNPGSTPTRSQANRRHSVRDPVQDPLIAYDLPSTSGSHLSSLSPSAAAAATAAQGRAAAQTAAAAKKQHASSSSTAPRVVSRQQQRLFHAARSLVQLNEVASGRESTSGPEASDNTQGIHRPARRTSMSGHLAEVRALQALMTGAAWCGGACGVAPHDERTRWWGASGFFVEWRNSMLQGRLEVAHQLTSSDPAAPGNFGFKRSKSYGGRQKQIAAMQASAALFLRTKNCRP